MSTTANSAVAGLSRKSLSNASHHPTKAALRLLAARVARRLTRFFDGLPERHGDIDPQLLKRVPGPI
jgi:hypothetical protein